MLLARTREDLSRYAVDKGAQASDQDAARALKTLVELGWVLELQGKPIKYRLNRDNAIVGHLAEFFAKAL
jgi:hypothetical protein